MRFYYFWIIFDADITCINPGPHKTADIRINGIEWEVKSPKGKDKNTIENILHKASKQSTNIILDLSRIKMPDAQALSRARYYLHSRKHDIKNILVIRKDKTIVDLGSEL